MKLDSSIPDLNLHRIWVMSRAEPITARRDRDVLIDGVHGGCSLSLQEKLEQRGILNFRQLRNID